MSPDGEADSDLAAIDALNALKHFEMIHHLDPNLPLEELYEVDAALNAASAEKGIEVEQILIEDNSPYPEVRMPPASSILHPPRRFRIVESRPADWGGFKRSEHQCAISMLICP